MPVCTTCNLCDKPGTLETAVDVASVPCHVRQYKDEKFTVWRCHNCDSLHSMEDVDLARFYLGYTAAQSKQRLDPHTYIGYHNRLRLLRARGIRPDDRILDYGCGPGLYVRFLKKNGYPNTFGYDEYGENHADKTVLAAQYDVIISHDVIEHVPEPRDYMQTLNAMLKPGGLLVIGTPNAEHIRLKADPYFPAELSQPYHQHILSEKVLMDIAKQQGLQPEHRYRRFYFDSLYPSINTRFIWAYVDALGGMLDVAIEPPRYDVIFRSPKLLFWMFFGYFFPSRANILVSFRKP